MWLIANNWSQLLFRCAHCVLYLLVLTALKQILKIRINLNQPWSIFTWCDDNTIVLPKTICLSHMVYVITYNTSLTAFYKSFYHFSLQSFGIKINNPASLLYSPVISFWLMRNIITDHLDLIDCPSDCNIFTD